MKHVCTGIQQELLNWEVFELGGIPQELLNCKELGDFEMGRRQLLTWKRYLKTALQLKKKNNSRLKKEDNC